MPVSLVLLVATLATLQYRWLGQVSEAERDRLRASLSQRASEFADDFDREIVRLYLSLQVDGGRSIAASGRVCEELRHVARVRAVPRDAARGVPRQRQHARAGRAQVRPGGARVRRRILAGVARAGQRAARQDQLSLGRDADAAATASGAGPGASSMTPGRSAQVAAIEQLRHFVTGRDPIVASVPALIITLPRIDRPEVTGQRPTVVSVRLGQSVVVAELDGAYLTSSVLPTLAERYFPERDADMYRFAVVDSTDRGKTVYARGVADGSTHRFESRGRDDAALRDPAGAGDAGRHADVADRSRPSATFSAPRHDAPQHQREPIVRQRSRACRSSSSHAAPPPTTCSSSPRSTLRGSCACSTRPDRSTRRSTHARRRNLWLSFGILAVLAAGVGLDRRQRPAVGSGWPRSRWTSSRRCRTNCGRRWPSSGRPRRICRPASCTSRRRPGGTAI